MKELRTALAANATYSVVKNTLTKIAAEQAGVGGIDRLLVGPERVGVRPGRPGGGRQGLRAFAKDHPALVIKGGVMEGKVLTPADISKLADLESREVLLAKLAGAMKASTAGAAALFAAPIAQTARLAETLRAKVEAEGGAAAPAADASEETTADVSADDQGLMPTNPQLVARALGCSSRKEPPTWRNDH